MVKVVVFVLQTHADKVRAAIGDSGGGNIGNYSHNSFSIKGIGRFKPGKRAKPAIGEVGKLEEVEEDRVEFICERKNAKTVLEAVRKVHPYEEVAFDVYPLISEEELS